MSTEALPATLQVFRLPDLGEGLTEAELVNWLVKEGDEVRVDQPVAEVETAKAVVEVPCPYAGTVAVLHGAAGETLDVGAPLISVRAAGAPAAEAPAVQPPAAGAAPRVGPVGGTTAGPEAETYRNEERAGISTAAAAAAAPEPEQGSGNVLIGYGTPGGTTGKRTRARRTAGSPQRQAAATPAPVTPGAVAPAAPDGGIGVQAVRCISPLVRRMAVEGGLVLRELSGSGPDGLILRRDVEAALAGRGTGAPAAPGGERPAMEQPAVEASTVESSTVKRPASGIDQRSGLAVLERLPLRGMRRTIADTLSRSRREIPEATVWVDVDATALLDLRASLKSDGGAPGLLAFIARFVVAGLAKYPELNTRVLTGKDGSQELLTVEGINLGVAAQTERGLVVPSIRRADLLNARALDAEIRRLTEAARAGKATPAELTSGTFTLNNYGVFGVDGSAAIINHPESAILGVGRIIDRPWVVDGALAVRKVTELTLTFDHRVCDGGTAGGFLRFVADAMENPARLLADL
ncbi:2-oxo acid dehydrogenase subunit E2 [Arthrobacter crusticola]|uniref:Dihydrolipoamide acetyltransferase component of pyruvate dehydrogenase complex n=1 Tax=Arthrobacter crusticola TaxID=2547960 RepID=A0A4R5TWP8_9MICC|nr:dihydrolipoamide acetyltransferase family protein [Arthrobacter crusticola]TDK25518.1 2-oxo acid dehydrogenase subunit E2 [Arthrobacter crusticola]